MLETLPRYLFFPEDAQQEKAALIVVGGGIAGLTAALQCSKHQRVLLIMKKDFSDCSTYYAQGGIAAATNLPDSPCQHFQDSLQAGNYFCNEKNLGIMIAEAPAAIDFLIKKGVKFDKNNDTFSLAREGGHTMRRIFRINGDGTGQGLIDVLKACVLQADNITVIHNSFLVDILTAFILVSCLF